MKEFNFVVSNFSSFAFTCAVTGLYPLPSHPWLWLATILKTTFLTEALTQIASRSNPELSSEPCGLWQHVILPLRLHGVTPRKPQFEECINESQRFVVSASLLTSLCVWAVRFYVSLYACQHAWPPDQTLQPSVRLSTLRYNRVRHSLSLNDWPICLWRSLGHCWQTKYTSDCIWQISCFNICHPMDIECALFWKRYQTGLRHWIGFTHIFGHRAVR